MLEINKAFFADHCEFGGLIKFPPKIAASVRLKNSTKLITCRKVLVNCTGMKTQHYSIMEIWQNKARPLHISHVIMQ